MFRLVLPCCDIDIKSDAVSSEDGKAKIRFKWLTKNTFIKSVMWWTHSGVVDTTGHWRPKIACGDWERGFKVPTMSYLDTTTMTGEWLCYNSSLNNQELVSEDGCFEIRFKRGKRVPLYVPHTPFAGHDVEYQATVTLPFDELPEAAKALAESNLEKKKAEEDASKRKMELKRKAEELRAMAAELEAEAQKIQRTE